MTRTALDRWNRRIRYGLWLDPDVSKPILEAGTLDAHLSALGLDPAPDALITKFGGDWGGEWGNPATWGNLSPKSQNPPKIPVLPYLYIKPGHADAYPAIVGGLLSDGYPAVVLDAEMEWAGHEGELADLLDQLNPAANLIGLCGFAWFQGWPNAGRDFGAAVNDHDIVYMPMAYAGMDWTPPDGQDFFHGIAGELSRVVPSLPKSWIYDAAAIDAGVCQQVLPSLAPSYWYSGTITPARWRLLHIPLSEDPTPAGGGLVGGDQAGIDDLIRSIDASLGATATAWGGIKRLIGG